ncbi:MAG: YhcH/YjgK/YiaL family protein [Flavisolibacter sp.]
MIVDKLENAHRYYALHPSFEKAFEWIAAQNAANLQSGKFEIEGDVLKASVSEKEGRKKEEAKFEAHDRHIDIQVCPAGTETLGWKPRQDCTSPIGDYNAEKDVRFFSDAPDTYFDLHAGQFAIFFPEDVHAPMIGSGIIKKLVVKVKI